MAPILCDRCNDVVRANEEETSNVNGCDPLDELAQLDSLLARLAVRRHDLKRKINRFHSPIVRQLPLDVMSIIFESCLPGFADFQPSASPSRLDLCVPLTLGAVCSYWREVAWSTPTLWSSLIIHATPGKSRIVVLREWLARSGQLPLSIRIFSIPPVLIATHRAVHALAFVINRYSARWSDFDLCLPQGFIQYFRAADNHAPNLKSIRLHNCEHDTHTGNFQLTCPHLQRVCLSWFRMGGINIQWDNVTHLNLKDLSIPYCLVILRKTPRLLFCEFSSVVGTAMLTPEAPVLTPLKFLRLGIMNRFTKHFLGCLISSHLEELSIGSHFNAVALIISLINRSGCSLRSFSTIDASVPGFEGLMNLLQLMPSLKKLSIMDGDILRRPWNILQIMAKVLSLQNTFPQQGLLSNLESFEYTGKLWLGQGNYIDLYPLPPTSHAVQGRLRLVKLDIYPEIHIPENAISFFSNLVGGGITVNVRSNSQDILQSSINYYRDRESQDWVDDLDLSLIQNLP